MRRRVAFLGALVMAASALVVGPVGTARAADPLTVQVGADFFSQGVPAASNRFLAPVLRVEQGQVVKFDFQGFHNAMLLPSNTDVSTFVARNVDDPGEPYSLVTFDPDDTAADGGSATAPSLKFNNGVFFPSNFLCGNDANPCSHDGTAISNSGVINPTYSVAIDAAPGDVIWVICNIHNHMRLRIEVVADASQATTQAAIDAFKTAAIARDLDWAVSMHKRMNRMSNHQSQDGNVFDVWVGKDNHWASLFAMYPKKLTIRKGQKVRFHFDELIYEPHTATFPFARARQEAQMLGAPVCDPDGDGGAGPDNPPDTEAPPFCNDPNQLELDIEADAAFPQGDGVFRGSDYENSGIRGAIGPTDSWDVRFAKASGDTPFKYMCVIHPEMRGAVVVK